MVTKLKAAGASDVIQYGATLRDADVYLKEHVITSVCLSSLLTYGVN
jgi:hypothetical protein